MPLFFSPGILKKLAEKHGVLEVEVRQCFINLEGSYLRDTREQHDTDPPSYWFISETNQRRKLKVVFVARKVDTPTGVQTRVDIKTAYPPAPDEIELYARWGQC